MMRNCLLIFTIILLVACKTGPGLFGKKSLHEQYANKLKQAGLSETVLGKLWIDEASKALKQPVKIALPYKEIGYFPAEKPRAAGLLFKAIRGQKLLFELELNPAGSLLFADLWKVENEPSLLLSIDSAQTNFEYEVDEEGDYLLRLQPELLSSCDYTLSISVGPSLGNPVAGDKGRIGSVWGDARDAGARQHEGIDIFAPFRTPVVAAADGMITRVNENNLGGKVVWMRPKGKNLSLYYAHLDEQLVRDGQNVKIGDTLGLIGNTGNARTTPPHLHFGIYTFGGAINPLPFVDPVIKKPVSFEGAASDLRSLARVSRNESAVMVNDTVELKRNVIVELAAVSANAFRVRLLNGVHAFVTKRGISEITSLKSLKLVAKAYLFDAPNDSAARLAEIKADTSVNVLGYFDEFTFVSVDGRKGWMPNTFISN